MSRIVLAAAALLCLAGSSLVAQETRPGSRYTNVDWFSITHIDYHASKTREALELVFDHFMPAGAEAGIPRPRILEYSTGGQWDLTMIFPMVGGPADLEWELDPTEERWISALAEREGGMSEAEALLERYQSMIARYETQIVRERAIRWSTPETRPAR